MIDIKTINKKKLSIENNKKIMPGSGGNPELFEYWYVRGDCITVETPGGNYVVCNKDITYSDGPTPFYDSKFICGGVCIENFTCIPKEESKTCEKKITYTDDCPCEVLFYDPQIKRFYFAPIEGEAIGFKDPNKGPDGVSFEPTKADSPQEVTWEFYNTPYNFKFDISSQDPGIGITTIFESGITLNNYGLYSDIIGVTMPVPSPWILEDVEITEAICDITIARPSEYLQTGSNAFQDPPIDEHTHFDANMSLVGYIVKTDENNIVTKLEAIGASVSLGTILYETTESFDITSIMQAFANRTYEGGEQLFIALAASEWPDPLELSAMSTDDLLNRYYIEYVNEEPNNVLDDPYIKVRHIYYPSLIVNNICISPKLDYEQDIIDYIPIE